MLFLVGTLLGAAAPTARQPADLIITNALVLTMNAHKDVIEHGVVVVKDAHIIAVGPAALADGYTATKTIDAAGAIVMPGMLNDHTHVAMTIFRGLGDDVGDRLKRFIFPIEKKLVDRDMVHWGARLGMIEMVQGGVTTLADHYYFADEVGLAAREIGIRAVVAETVINFPSPDSPEPYGGLALTRKMAAQFKDDPLVTPAIGPHSPYTLDAEHLKQIVSMSAELNLLVHMHVAETAEEVTMVRKEHNQTPIEYLDTLGLLNKRFLAAHCIFVNDSDIALMKARDIGVSHNMVANIKSAKGVAPAMKMFKAGVRVGLGTDGPMSGNTLDIIGQLGYVAKLHKLDNHDRTVMPAVDVVEMATMGGARALHMEDRLGSLEAGKLADVIIVDTSDPSMTPLYDPYTALVYAASPRDVRTTIINGRVVMENRKLLTIDGEVVKQHMRAIGEKITKAIANGIE